MFDILDIFLMHTICLFNTCIVNWIASFSLFIYFSWIANWGVPSDCVSV